VFKEDLLKGKRILVTGGGSGLGKEMSRYFLKYGAEVLICGRRVGVLEETAKELMDEQGGTVKCYGLDIRGPQDVDNTINEIFDEAPIHGLVNNAAGNFISRTEDLSHRGFDAIASIVFHGTFYVTHSVGKRWLDLGMGGNIISILATWVWTGSAFTVPSAMSKSGVHAMTQSLATEWGKTGIRINAIAPGPFPTEGAWARLSPGQDPDEAASDSSGAYSQNPMGRVGEMEELGNLATFLMSDGCNYLNGQTIAIDGAEYLTGGTFYRALASLKDEDWAAIKDTIKSTNEKDKANRSV
jgi:NAD(P)-dependent dehydrogenase (short-subunit alcohol dehydrogenase family)